MAGTDKTRGDLSFALRPGLAPRPVVVLVEPQLGENIGAAARAMYNFGLADMRLVAPRDKWPNERALAAASGATPILERVKVFETFREAVGDLGVLYAATARPRELVKPVLAPAAAAREIAGAPAETAPTGLLFGGERAGLTNEQVSRADKIISIPVNPAFASLNLAQAVLLVAYEWSRTWIEQEGPQEAPTGRLAPATKEAVYRFFDHLETELERTGFLFPPEKSPSMMRNIRSMFLRTDLSDQDVRTLRGMVKALSTGSRRAGTDDEDVDA